MAIQEEERRSTPMALRGTGGNRVAPATADDSTNSSPKRGRAGAWAVEASPAGTSHEGAAARKATFTPADAASAASSKEAEQPPPVPPPASAHLILKFGAPLCEVAFLFNTRQPYQLTARSRCRASRSFATTSTPDV